MTKYSGVTTQYRDNVGKSEPKDCIIQRTIFDVQWSNCPAEVEAEVARLWTDRSLGNDYYYTRWNSEDAEKYPIIAEYLTSRGVSDCLIHWWW
ncbi:MAG: hypothetical protein ACEQSB_00540 [Undibacterium sp.]